MVELTKAEIMLNQVTKSNSLIRQLELCKNRPIPPLRLDLGAFHQIHHKSISRECPKPYRSAYCPAGNGFGSCGADTGWRSPACLAVALWSYGQCHKENAVA